MKIQVGDIIGLFGWISGQRIVKVMGHDRYLLDDGQEAALSDVAVVQSDNGDGTATETFSDGRIRTVELE